MNTAKPVTEVIHTGRVKWFSSTKGYGFIIPDDRTEEVFVHFTGIISNGYKSLNDDDYVSYNLVKGNNPQKKVQAVNVQITEHS